MYPQYWTPSIGGCFFVLQIQRRIHIVHIFLIQLFPQELAGFTNTGNMKYSKRATNTYYWVTVSYRQSRKIVMKL